MKGLLGYGRYDDDPEAIGCPRAKSDMTPCVARDGWCAALTDGRCVGCEKHSADLLQEIVAVISKAPRATPEREQ